MKGGIGRKQVLNELFEATPQKKVFGLFGGGNKPDFSRREIKRICKIVEEQLPLSEPFIKIDGVFLPRAGHIFRVKQGTRYQFFAPGSLVLVVFTFITKSAFVDKDFKPEVNVTALNTEGRCIEAGEIKHFSVRSEDIEPILEEELASVLENRRKPHPQEDIFYDGEAVELIQDVTLKAESMGGAASYTLPKGLKGIIDKPEFQRGASLDDINSPHQRQNRVRIMTAITLKRDHVGHDLEKTFLDVPLEQKGQKYSVYFPAHQGNIELQYSQIRRRPFDKDMFFRVVMDDKTRQSILSLVLGREEMLSKWGITKSFHKGKGKVCLAFGPPGTGKTLTGEALAELLERPLYIADSTKLVPTPGNFERALQDVIDKTERWNSVTLIDEAEGILLSRDASYYDASWRIEAVLRNLERLERGILWFTTNRPVDIDPAINSRIRIQIYFPPLDAEKRRKVWECTFPKDFPVVGLTEEFLDELAAVEINGREISNAIMNAADRASYEGLDSVPAAYVLIAAKTIRESQDILENAKKKHYNPGRGNDFAFGRLAEKKS